MLHINNIFGDWSDLISSKESYKLLPELLYKYEFENVTPKKDDLFKAFKFTSPKNCCVVFLGQDPYPQKEVATGLLFGNKKDISESNYSASLKIIKNSVSNLENPNLIYTFDPTLEYWASQGILMLNAALSVEVGNVGSHIMLWRKWIAELLRNLSTKYPNILYVLFGEIAHTFSPYIINGKIIKTRHPAYYARTNTEMPSKLFEDINKYLNEYNRHINWCLTV